MDAPMRIRAMNAGASQCFRERLEKNDAASTRRPTALISDVGKSVVDGDAIAGRKSQYLKNYGNLIVNHLTGC